MSFSKTESENETFPSYTKRLSTGPTLNEHIT